MFLKVKKNERIDMLKIMMNSKNKFYVVKEMYYINIQFYLIKRNLITSYNSISTKFYKYIFIIDLYLIL